MGLTDVVEAAGLREGDGLRLPFLQYTGIPFPYFALFKRCRRVRDIADVCEGHRCPRLDPSAARKIAILDIVIADLDRVDAGRDWSRRPGNAQWRGRRPQWTQLSLQREHPHRIAVCTEHPLVAAGRDGDILLSVNLIDCRRGC